MRNKNPSLRRALCADGTGLAEPGLNLFWPGLPGNVLPFVPAKDPSVPRRSSRGSKSLLAELLALNLEMIEQLRVECLDAAGTTDFLTGMIEHHEKAAALLRAQLEGSAAEPT